jgi:hypothetical protein
MFTATYKKLLIYALLCIPAIAAMDTPQLSMVPQDIILTTLTNNIQVFKKNIDELHDEIILLTQFIHKDNSEPIEQKTKLDNSLQQNILCLANNKKALEFHKAFLARKTAADKQARLYMEEGQKFMQKMQLERELRQKQEEKQNLEKVATALEYVQKFGKDTIQKAQKDIPTLNQQITITQAKLEEAQKDRDDHNQKLPYICDGIIALIVASIYACKYFYAH